MFPQNAYRNQWSPSRPNIYLARSPAANMDRMKASQDPPFARENLPLGEKPLEEHAWSTIGSQFDDAKVDANTSTQSAPRTITIEDPFKIVTYNTTDLSTVAPAQDQKLKPWCHDASGSPTHSHNCQTPRYAKIRRSSSPFDGLLVPISPSNINLRASSLTSQNENSDWLSRSNASKFDSGYGSMIAPSDEVTADQIQNHPLKRKRRIFSEEEKEQIKATRAVGACTQCRRRKVKVSHSNVKTPQGKSR